MGTRILLKFGKQLGKLMEEEAIEGCYTVTAGNRRKSLLLRSSYSNTELRTKRVLHSCSLTRLYA